MNGNIDLFAVSLTCLLYDRLDTDIDVYDILFIYHNLICDNINLYAIYTFHRYRLVCGHRLSSCVTGV